MEEVCKQLDSVLLEVMSSLQELSRLRERYSAAVKEVGRYAYGVTCVLYTHTDNTFQVPIDVVIKLLNRERL